MRGAKLHWGVLMAITLGLMLALASTGLAQEATPAAEPAVAEGEAASAVAETTTEVITETAVTTATVSAGAEITPTIAAMDEVTPTIAITTTVEMTAALTTTDVLTATEAAEAVAAIEEPEAEPALLELTVYNQNRGLVKELRTLDLDSGENEVRFSDVASGIDPTSVHVVSLTDPEGTVVLEQNYEYDIVGTSKLLSKYIDQPIEVKTEQGDSYSGTLLSGAGDVILDTEDGIKVVRMAQIQEYTFPELPEGLITKPTLVWLLQAADAGEQDVRVTYLTNGIDWRADYVAVLAPDNESLSLAGWVTVENNSGATYEDARLKLVAGDINVVEQDDVRVYKAETLQAAGMPAVEERAFFEYHIYEIQRPVTVRDDQIKQIEFSSAPEVDAQTVYVLDAAPKVSVGAGDVISDPDYGIDTNADVQVSLELANTEDAGLGIPLPAGVVRVYQEDSAGGSELIGEDSIDHTPTNEDISLALGNAFDVVGERVQTSFRKIGETALEEGYTISVRNRRDRAVTVRVIERLFRSQDAEIVVSSDDYEMLDATRAQWQVTVAPDDEATISYTVRYEW